MIEWTNEDSRAAYDEGWDIFDSEGSQNGPWQIQKFDDPDSGPQVFTEDTDAWVQVRTRASEGSALHIKALAFLRQYNPQEADAIERWQEESVK
jgi:hypothetical protein